MTTLTGVRVEDQSVDILQSDFKVTPDQLETLLDNKTLTFLTENFGSVHGVIEKLGVDLKAGMKSDAVQVSRQVFGKNELPHKEMTSILTLIKEALSDKILIMLIIASVVSLIFGIYEDSSSGKNEQKWLEGVGILFAVIIVVIVGVLNDYQKERQFRKLNDKREDRDVKVYRDNKYNMIPIGELVVGDILLIESGDILPGDGLLIESKSLKMDESSMTGESDAVSKSAEKDPFLISATKVLEGNGKIIITAVGPRTSFGKILTSLQTETEQTPLQIQLEKFAELIAKVGGASSLILFCSLLLKYFISPPPGANTFRVLLEIFIQCITIIVVAVPEGLPMAVAISLAFATSKMIKDNNLVRVLSACETMGNASTICSDKTGTLTMNKMTVVQAELFGIVLHKGDSVLKLKQAMGEAANLYAISVALNSTAVETWDDRNQKNVYRGSNTEVALLRFITEMGFNYTEIRQKTTIEYAIPFSSEKKFMASVIKLENGFRIFLKGASEVILRRCNFYVDAQGVVHPMDHEHVQKFNTTIEAYAKRALRTISFAYQDIMSHDNTTIPEQNYCFCGVVGIEDPLRPEVKKAIMQCQKAGVSVRMVTGDNLETAKAISYECGILNRNGIAMEGPEFRKLNETEMKNILPKLQVLARSSPLDKRILIKGLRGINEIVAVTGDGTNDGPALKAANVGFSMGITGTEVAKEASSIILMDDNFASIVKAIGWGRCINESVRKFLQFQLTVNVTAVLLAYISAVSSSESQSVLTTIQLLWVNLLMDTFAALALATGDPTPEMLETKSRYHEGLIYYDMWKMIIGQTIYQLTLNLVILYAGASIFKIENSEVLSTFIFNVFVFLQVFNEINCREIGKNLNVFKNFFNNWMFLAIIGFTTVVQFLIVTFGGKVFGTVPLPFTLWLYTILLSSITLLVGVLVRISPDFFKPKPAPIPVAPDHSKALWQNAITDVRSELKVFKMLRKDPSRVLAKSLSFGSNGSVNKS